MDPTLPVPAADPILAGLPAELPGLADIAAAVFSWLASTALKRFAKGKTWERTARRALPVLAPAVGAAVQVAYAALVTGTPLGTAALRGAIAGAAAVYAHGAHKATVKGEVGGKKSEATEPTP